MQNQTSARRALPRSMVNEAYLLPEDIQNAFLHPNQAFQLVEDKEADVHGGLRPRRQPTPSLDPLIGRHLGQKLLMPAARRRLLASGTLALPGRHRVPTELVDPFNERFGDLEKSAKSRREGGAHTAQGVRVTYGQAGFAPVRTPFALLGRLIPAPQCVRAVPVRRIEKVPGAPDAEGVFEAGRGAGAALGHWRGGGLQTC